MTTSTSFTQKNDNEAFGAIDAIKAAGETVGSDIKNGQIMVMTFDSTKTGLTDALDGSSLLIQNATRYTDRSFRNDRTASGRQDALIR